ncbi:MAG: DUF4115 domain-containing protein [Oxalicibacterium faecigallinarum]|uniref:XRE family transcriptional regulator n=1 Tax=Oxalicibacterium faecigallinarum TaxID=573741 RepID=A0A8J3ANY4_9BURK|nr:helix-turn-helix domain-containing protein [Oxalicibacterium faecigallinarum]MDQ7968749.1 DUF4115 domain-containing protein [Oxalicibacterium faecigallinarum]GGI16164.1 XRE family transcriptional regulator [Oxalicibacterium faecigallinarum]
MNDEVVQNDENGTSSESPRQHQDQQPQISAGAQLRMLRESRGWSIEQVASQLNLAPRQIEALEEDNFAALPGLVIVRGFIRTYAKLLRVDPAPILAAVASPVEAANVVPERAPLSASFSETSVPFGKRRSPSALMIIAALVVLGGILFFVARSAGWIPPTELAAVMKDGSVVKELPVESADFVEPTPQEQTFEETSSAESNADTSVENKAVDAPAAAVTTPAIVPAPVAAQVVTPAPAANATAAPPASVANGKNKMVFKVAEDSWVEIKLAEDDSIVVSRILQAGTTEAFDIPGPASVVIGNAAGVSVSLRGTPLNITGSSSNVARLNVK